MKTLPMSKIKMLAFIVLIIAVIATRHSLLRGQGAAQGDSVAQAVRHDPSRELADRATGSDPSLTDYILEQPAKCPNCCRDIFEKTLIEPA